ncbi:MAG: hypothetical protein MSH53_07655, partial [Solobacterium sp.]|nr:hypothetical protein [Solobacterium sp.]
YYYLKRNNIEDFEELGDCNLKYPVQTFATMKALTGDSRFEIAYNDYEETHKDDKGVTMEKILDTIEARGEARGEAKGKELQARETAINLKNMNMDEETIAKAVGRDTETVKKWISFN